MFIDASAIAILNGKRLAHDLVDTFEKARNPITSPIAIFEALLGLSQHGTR